MSPDINGYSAIISQAILVNIGQVRDVNDDGLYKEMIDDWVLGADTIFSLGSKLYEFYEDIYRCTSFTFMLRLHCLTPRQTQVPIN